jgi:hypothetical protein
MKFSAPTLFWISFIDFVSPCLVKGTPSKARVIQPKTPASSAKKRKVQEDTESDAEDHYTTEEETPVKHKSIRRGAATLGSRGNKKGIRNNTRTHIKQGNQTYPLSSVTITYIIQSCPRMPVSTSSPLVHLS